jgi:hypothetical protein
LGPCLGPKRSSDGATCGLRTAGAADGTKGRADPPEGTARDSAEFKAFLAAEQQVGDYIAEHQAELEPLRLPRDGMTAGKYQAILGRLDAELAWLEPHAARGGPAVAAYDAAWKDRMAFVANYQPDAGTRAPALQPDPDPEPDLEA